MKIPMPILGMVRLRETDIGDIVVIDPEISNDFWICCVVERRWRCKINEHQQDNDKGLSHKRSR